MDTISRSQSTQTHVPGVPCHAILKVCPILKKEEVGSVFVCAFLGAVCVSGAVCKEGRARGVRGVCGEVCGEGGCVRRRRRKGEGDHFHTFT